MLLYIAILLGFGDVYFLDSKKGEQLEVESFQNKLPLFQTTLNEAKNKIFFSSIKKATGYKFFNIAEIEPAFTCRIVTFKLL